MSICKTCGTFESVNADPYKRPLPLLNPTRQEVVAYHPAGTPGKFFIAVGFVCVSIMI